MRLARSVSEREAFSGASPSPWAVASSGRPETGRGNLRTLTLRDVGSSNYNQEVLPKTDALHHDLTSLGKALGFVATREVSDSLLALHLADGYRPRIDLMWSLEIDEAKRGAIAQVTGQDVGALRHVPVVGIEVEGSDPTTKTMMSDVANLRALGAPLGLLVVNESYEEGLYRRAGRAIRTMRRNLGDLSVVPAEAAWVREMSRKEWDPRPCALSAPPRKAARGGERTTWTVEARKSLIELGNAAGFVVADPLKPRQVAARFEAEASRRDQPMTELWLPATGERRVIRNAKNYTTESEIDLAWLLPLPKGLSAFLQALCDKDPTLQEHDLLYPALWDSIPIVGFELDSHPGKHGGGGLLNLSAYCVVGVTFAPDERTASALQRTVQTYARALGIRNVYVRTAP